MWHEMTCRVVQKYLFKKINGTLPFPPPKDIHISDVYANWFESIFGMHLDAPARVPFINIPRKWILFAKLRLLKWNIDKKTNPFNKVIFINNYAKDNIRSWPLENVFELIKNIKKNDTWGDIIFLINTPPEYLLQVKKMYQKYSLTQTHIVSADLNFFQLPAYIAVSDLIISVETSTIHLAAALDKPVITLMRTKNPEWVPWDNGKITNIFCKHRPDWVKYIPLETVVEAVKNHDILKCLFKCMSKEPRQETFNLNVVNACGNQSANGKG
jgi:ADP-heptose:LPS heptosyltransferase